MIAYNRVMELLHELGAECTSEMESAASRFSEWRLGSQRFALRADNRDGLRLYRLHCQSAPGRPDPIMDALTSLLAQGPHDPSPGSDAPAP